MLAVVPIEQCFHGSYCFPDGLGRVKSHSDGSAVPFEVAVLLLTCAAELKFVVWLFGVLLQL